MQKQHGSELQEIEIIDIYVRRATSYTTDEHSLSEYDYVLQILC